MCATPSHGVDCPSARAISIKYARWVRYGTLRVESVSNNSPLLPYPASCTVVLPTCGVEEINSGLPRPWYKLPLALGLHARCGLTPETRSNMMGFRADYRGLSNCAVQQRCPRVPSEIHGYVIAGNVFGDTYVFPW